MNDSIHCPICGTKANTHFEQTIDFQFRTNYKIDYYLCTNFNCRHLFSDPKQIKNITELYTEYTTHTIPSKNVFSKFIEIYIYFIEVFFSAKSIIQDKKRILPLKINHDASILDYGCGSGEFLWILQRKKWKNLTGFDFDNKALDAAKSREVNCTLTSDFNKLNTYDVINLNHVIEHIPDVNELIDSIKTIKKINGIIIIRTPNSASLCSIFFGQFWRGLESPRHFHLFTPQSLTRLCKKHDLNIIKISTGNRLLFGSYLESWVILFTYIKQPVFIAKLIALSLYPFFVVTHTVINIFNPLRNEEIILVVS